MTSVRNLITLEDLKPDKLLKHIFKDFDFKKMMGIQEKEQQLYSNEESLSLGSTSYWVNMSAILMLVAIIPTLILAFFLLSQFLKFFGFRSLGKQI